jgi:hypothetical protein
MYVDDYIPPTIRKLATVQMECNWSNDNNAHATEHHFPSPIWERFLSRTQLTFLEIENHGENNLRDLARFLPLLATIKLHIPRGGGGLNALSESHSLTDLQLVTHGKCIPNLTTTLPYVQRLTIDWTNMLTEPCRWLLKTMAPFLPALRECPKLDSVSFLKMEFNGCGTESKNQAWWSTWRSFHPNIKTLAFHDCIWT